MTTIHQDMDLVVLKKEKTSKSTVTNNKNKINNKKDTTKKEKPIAKKTPPEPKKKEKDYCIFIIKNLPFFHLLLCCHINSHWKKIQVFYQSKLLYYKVK